MIKKLTQTASRSINAPNRFGIFNNYNEQSFHGKSLTLEEKRNIKTTLSKSIDHSSLAEIRNIKDSGFRNNQASQQVQRAFQMGMENINTTSETHQHRSVSMKLSAC